MSSKWTARQISILLTIIALLLWSYSISQAKLNIGYYGLISSYPISFFVALGLLTVASAILWISRENHSKLLCLQLCFFITAIYLTPVLIGSNPPFINHIYNQFGYSKYIIEHGHLDPATLMYHNWPGTFILETMFMGILGTQNPDLIASLSAFLMQFLILLPLYVFFKNTINNTNYIWAACWLFYLGNRTGQIWFGPMGFSIFLLFILLALLTNNKFREKTIIPMKYRLISILTIASITITHILISITGFLTIAAFSFIRKSRDTYLIVVTATIIIIWTIYGAISQFEYRLPNFVDEIFRFDILFSGEIGQHLGNTSKSYEAVNFITILFIALFIFLGIVGVILSRKSKDKSDFTIMILATVPIIMLPFVFYSGVFTRLLLLIMLPIAYFGTKLIKFKATFIMFCLFLLIALPLHIVAHYGDAAYQHLPTSEIAKWHFINDNTTQGCEIGSSNDVLVGGPNYTKAVFSQLEWENNQLLGGFVNSSTLQYINISDFNQSVYEYRYDDPQLIPEMGNHLENSPYYNLIYANPEVTLYVRENN